jgi:Fe-S oxidoreductase
MLTVLEKILFGLAVAATLAAAFFAIRRLIGIIGQGGGQPDWKLAARRLAGVLARIAVFQPVFRFRRGVSLFHALVGWGFGFYLLVNVLDVARGYLPGFEIPGPAGNVYRLLADALSVGVLAGTTFFLVRRFLFRPAHLAARETTLLHPKARAGIRRDSAIVGAFILLHVGARFLGEAFAVAAAGEGDRWQPVASAAAGLWSGWSPAALVIGEHIAFWLALGLILAFIPYFPYSKHIHLFFAPLNFLLKPARRSMGELSRLDFEDESVTQFGAAKLADLGWEQRMDAFACIMCFRCQQVCPAYATGKLLSPAALEINKRYVLNEVKGRPISRGERRIALPETPLTQFAIPEEAVWACTSCGACVDICPVNNEPMRDILDIRRSLVLMDNAFPRQLETAFRGMERTANPWNIPPAERMKWAEGLDVPTIEQNPQPGLLWWVGCAPSTDARAQKAARAFAKILHAAGVNFAVLGEREQCTGDSARRAGNEYLFNELAAANVATLNAVKPKRIVTTCPHCLHTLKNEYPAFGGNYEVVHHTQLISDLIGSGQLELQPQSKIGNPQSAITYHDPCYLGRHNKVFAAPRQALKAARLALTEMPRHAAQSFCCGAGGAQMWKEEEHGTINVNKARFAEARATLQSAAGPLAGAATLAVGCPFCLAMLTDAARADGGRMQVKDVAELVAERLGGDSLRQEAGRV